MTTLELLQVEAAEKRAERLLDEVNKIIRKIADLEEARDTAIAVANAAEKEALHMRLTYQFRDEKAQESPQ